MGIRLVGAGAALLLQVTLARMLGYQGYGEYAYVFAWLQLLLIFAQGGFTMAALRYLPEYQTRDQPRLAFGFLKRSAQVVLLESTLLALLMAACAVALSSSAPTGTVKNFLIASAALPILAQLALSGAVIRGLGHVIPGMAVTLTHPLILLGVLLITGSLFRGQLSSSGALSLTLAAAVCSLGGVLLLRKRLGNGSIQATPECVYRTGEWLGTATQMMIASGLVYLQGRTGVIIAGLLVDVQQAGTYAVMERLADVVLLGITSLNLLVGPKFAALHAQGRRDELQRYARLAAWGATCFMLVTALPLIVFGKSILLLFGEKFVSGYPVLVVLLGGAAVNAMCGSVGLVLNMTGHHHRVLRILAEGLVVNLALNALLVPYYGILGTACANAITVVLWNIRLWHAVRVHLGIWSNVGRLDSNTFI